MGKGYNEPAVQAVHALLNYYESMPFSSRLRAWAATSPLRPAVTVGDQTLNYGELFRTAAASGSTDPLAVIDVPNGTDLAAQFCAAAVHKRTAMVLDATWPETLRQQLGSRARAWADQSAAGERPFLLGLSSGTSGVPKAFSRCTASWAESFTQSVKYFDVRADCTTLAPGPMAASMNLYALGESLHAGGHLVALPHFTADAALEAMDRHAATRLVLVPTVLEMIAARGIAKARSAEALRHIVCAGAALSPQTLELAQKWAPHARIQTYYGAAELGFVTAATVAQPLGNGAADLGAGHAFPGVDISIRTAAGEALPAGVTGNVSVRSPYVCQGYVWGDDGLAFSSVPGEPRWFTVGDRGFLTPDGVLHLAGRAGDMVLTSGNNVYPHEVEETLRDAAPRGIVVTGLPDPHRGQLLVAGILAASGTGTDTATLVAACRAACLELPASHRPRAWYSLAELPLTGSGKVSRTLLRNWIREADPRVARLS